MVRYNFAVEEILSAHDYHPCGYHYVGKEQIALALDSRIVPILKGKELLVANPDMDNDGICKLYNDAEYLPNLKPDWSPPCALQWRRAASDQILIQGGKHGNHLHHRPS